MRRRALIGSNNYIAPESSAFIFTVNTAYTEAGSSASNEFKLACRTKSGLLDANCNYKIIWGDGQESLTSGVSDPELTHSYATPGIYRIKVYPRKNTGRISIFINNVAANDKVKYIEIEQMGFAEVDSFNGLSNLVSFKANDLDYWNSLTDVSNMCRRWFIYNSPFPNNFRFDSAINATSLLHDARLLNQPLPYSALPSVVDASGVFYDCRVYNQALPSGALVNATNITSAFQNMYAMEELEVDDCSNITVGGISAFNSCAALIKIIMPGLSVSFRISWSVNMPEQGYLDLIDSLADMTGLSSPTMTVKNTVEWTGACDSAAAAKNWTVSKV